MCRRLEHRFDVGENYQKGLLDQGELKLGRRNKEQSGEGDSSEFRASGGRGVKLDPHKAVRRSDKGSHQGGWPKSDGLGDHVKFV